jgi:hypothetical protein
MAGAEAAEEPSKPAEEPSKPAEPATPASAGDDHPPPGPPADKLGARADTDGEADEEPEEVDFEAAIDAVRPARIELDFEADVPDREQETARARPAEPAESKRPAEEPVEARRPPTERPELTADAALAGAGFETDGAPAKARASRVPRKPPLAAITGPKKARVAAAVGGGVLVVAALVGGYIVFSDRDATSEDAGTGRAAETAPPAEGGVGTEQGAAAVVTPAQIDSAGRETLGVISQFYGRAVALDDGQATCDDLGEALIAVENAWLTYNADYKARFTAPLPELFAQRDERLVAGMRDVERLYDESECPRP